MSSQIDRDLLLGLNALRTQGTLDGRSFLQASFYVRRRCFEDALRMTLEEDKISLVSAGHQGPAWKVTVQTQVQGIQTFKAALDPGQSHYSIQTLGSLIRRVRAACDPNNEPNRSNDDDTKILG